MEYISKNVRIPHELINKFDEEARRVQRTRNAIMVMMLEDAIVSLNYVQGYKRIHHEELPSDDLFSGSDVCKVRFPLALYDVIVNKIPDIGAGGIQTPESFSEKVRYLLITGLYSGRSLVPVELSSVHGKVYEDEEIHSKFIDLKMGDNDKLDRLLSMAQKFEQQMLSTQGNVLILGEPGSGKSFCAGYYKTAKMDLCHYLDLLKLHGRKRGTRLLWERHDAHPEGQELVIDDASGFDLDEEYLRMFLRESHKKNVRVILVGDVESAFSKETLLHLPVRFDFNHDADGRCKWMSEKMGH